MKNFIKKTERLLIIVFVLCTTSDFSFAQSYDAYTSYPTYDTYTSSPVYDTYTSSPSYNTYTSQTSSVSPTYNTYTSYPSYNTSASYPTYDTYTSYPSSSYTTPSYTTPAYTTPVTSYSTYTPSTSSYTTPVVYSSSASYGYPNYSYSNYISPSYGYTNYDYTNSGYTNYGYTNYGYSNYGGNYSNPVVSCPVGTTKVNGVCVANTVTCPAGTTNVNGVCTSNTINCPVGSSLVNGVCTTNTVNYGYTNYGYTNYGYTNYGYSNNTTSYNHNYSNAYQTCWDGSYIPTNSTCATQYKTCPTGSVIPFSQICQNINTNYYVAPQTVRFNNVVTSVATQITNNSARCNGIGLIANSVQSTGWFEYGETSALGRATAKANIGTSNTAPFSNVLVNLKPTTQYYCRAVMENQYGIVKGEVVGFTTNSKAISYVAPKVTTTKKAVTKKKEEVVCADGTTAKLSSETTAGIISSGEKLVTVNLDKITGNLSPKSDVMYRLAYKNISDSRLNDVAVKISVPQEFTFVSSSAGEYDDITHTVTFNQNTIDPYSEGVITWKVNVKDTAMLGKSVVTSGYVSYTISSNKKTPLQDEVVTYSVGSIIPSSDAQEAGAKKVVGTSTLGFLPSNLIEWFALIAIMFILFILGRSIYATYQEEEEKH